MVGLLTLISPLLRMRSSLPACSGIRVKLWCGLIAPPPPYSLRGASRVCMLHDRTGTAGQGFGAKRVPQTNWRRMKHLTHVLLVFFWKFGGPGLLVLGILDSSFLFAPLGNDLLVVAMTAHNRSVG